MKLRSHTISLFILVWFFHINGVSQKLSAKDYIESFKEDAVKEMCLNRIPASIVLAQAMFESANGNSELAKNANNHFGIKCKKEWNGESYSKDDETEQECFRKYISVLESYTDHSNFLKTRPRYAFLFDIPVTDYKAWCFGLKDAGYATDPKYAKRLIDIIEKYKLYELDKHPLIEKPEFPGIEIAMPELDIREVYRFNRGKFIITKQGDSFFKIASEFNIELEKLLEYNDINRGDKIEIGQKLFLEPKRERAKEPYHLVQKGETLRSISQIHGIKLTVLCKNNHLKPENELKPGEILYLRGKKPFEALHLTSQGNSFK
ncbi:MAG TPA: glucosaminidase domain-containing protein [Bacteroidia bacterium]|nr:glucosaminidase domain-containing protein [Bacteroidia bacterium]